MSVNISCGDSAFLAGFAVTLDALNISPDVKAEPLLLLDKPTGWAALDHKEVDYSRCIILSDNRCPSYQLDLLERDPAALITFSEAETLPLILKSIDSGKSFYPRVVSPLTPVQRTTLRLVALGHTNKEIAVKRGVAERTVKNALVNIYDKLNLRSRVQASHYYLDNWHLLKRTSPPS